MSDNVAITAGVGTTIATDDVSGTHYQYVKLVDGTADATGKIGGDASNGLDVDVTRVQGTVTTAPAVASTATLSNVNDTASSTSLVASNSSRKGLIVYNDSTSTLYLKYGTTASATSFTVKIGAAGYWEMPAPIYTGAVDGIWSADSTGAARITEL